MASSYTTENTSIFIEGFICPECQSDMASVEMLQAHFELVHMQKKRNQNAANNPGTNPVNGKFSSRPKFQILVVFDCISKLLKIFL